MKGTLSALNKAIKASGFSDCIDVVESSTGYERSINLYIDGATFDCMEITCLCAVYYNVKGDRSKAIEGLISDIQYGITKGDK